MSVVGRWSLRLGAGLLILAVRCSGPLLGLVAVGIAGYDAVYEWLTRYELRRQGAKAAARREIDAREGR